MKYTGGYFSFGFQDHIILVFIRIAAKITTQFMVRRTVITGSVSSFT